MADDNVVEIRFGASTDDALDGIAQVRDALAGLNAPVQNLQGVLGRLNAAFGSAVPADMLSEAIEAFEGLGNQAARAPCFR